MDSSEGNDLDETDDCISHILDEMTTERKNSFYLEILNTPISLNEKYEIIKEIEQNQQEESLLEFNMKLLLGIIVEDEKEIYKIKKVLSKNKKLKESFDKNE
uniref:Uncharacterized protein n=1 Tax=Meloidogyne hapla TaxID=6305 RepID=A0A1I8BJW8_MELHA